MPTDFVIDEKTRTVFSKGWGVFTYPEALAYMDQLFQDPRFHPEFNQVVDCRDVTVVELTGDEVRDFAMRSGFSAQSLRAFVVSSDLQFGLTRMYDTYRHDENIKIFREMPDALAWLGLPADADPHPRRQIQPSRPA